MTLKSFIKYSILTIFGTLPYLTFAQQSNSLYFMDGIPQSNQLNPAVQPKCNIYIGFPGFSSVEINGGNSAISFSDIFTKMPGTDSLVWPIYSTDTKTKFLNNFGDVNYFNTDLRYDWISFGFRIKNTYLSFTAGDRMESYGFIPKDLIRLAMNLNYSSQGSETFDFSNFGVKSQWYREYSIGVSQEINPNLTFGIRAKLLYGIASMVTTNSDIQLSNTGPVTWQTHSTIDMNSSIPNLKLAYKANGDVDFDKSEITDINGASGARKILLNTKNAGFALDLGIIGKPVKNLSVSASVIDLGFIRWKDNINNFTQDGTYNFNGLDLQINDSINTGDAILDTLENVYAVNTTHDPYTTSITGKIYAGVHYQLIKGIGFGAVTRLQILKNNIKPQFTFSINLNPGKAFNTTFSYTIADGVFDNFGIGLSFKVGPFNTYFICDRIPIYYTKEKSSGAPIPSYAKSVNFRTGINLMFGYTRNKKALKDKPLYSR